MIVIRRNIGKLTGNNGLSESHDLGIGVDNVLDDAFDAILEQKSVSARAATHGVVSTNLEYVANGM